MQHERNPFSRKLAEHFFWPRVGGSGAGRRALARMLAEAERRAIFFFLEFLWRRTGKTWHLQLTSESGRIVAESRGIRLRHDIEFVWQDPEKVRLVEACLALRVGLPVCWKDAERRGLVSRSSY